MVKKICVYTCIMGKYDNLNEISEDVYESNIDYYCFTNNKNIKSDTWKVIYIENNQLSNQLLARKIKILGNNIVEKYDITVWIDGNTIIKKKISEFLEKEIKLNKYDISSFRHRFRDCIYDEAVECVKLKKDNKEIIKKQVEFLKKEKYPRHNGLYETGILVRKNNKLVKNVMELWYTMVSNYSIRDQLSFNYIIYKTKIKTQTINMDVTENNYFNIISHIKNNKIDSYRAYFGKDDSYAKFNYDLDIQGKYEIYNDKYTAKLKVPVDTQYIKFEITDVKGVFFNNVEIKTKLLKEYKINNYLEIKGKKYFYHIIPYIDLYGDFKKDELITISLEMKKIDEYNYNILILDYNDEYQKTLIKLNEIKEDIENKNNVLQLSQKNNSVLRKKNKLLIKEKKDLNDKIEKQLNKINELEVKYQRVINSKGWKLLEKLRKIKNSI